jgi:hypothetical protein
MTEAMGEYHSLPEDSALRAGKTAAPSRSAAPVTVINVFEMLVFICFSGPPHHVVATMSPSRQVRETDGAPVLYDRSYGFPTHGTLDLYRERPDLVISLAPDSRHKWSGSG